MEVLTLLKIMKSCNPEALCTISENTNGTVCLSWGVYEVNVRPGQICIGNRMFQKMLHEAKEMMKKNRN